MRPRWPRSGASAVLAAALAVLLAGCRLDVAVQVDVDREGGGTLHVELTADRALLTRAAASGVDPLRRLADEVERLPGWQAREATSDGGGRTVGVRGEFADPAAFNELTAQFAAALAGPELRPIEHLRLERDGDRLQLSGAANLIPTAEVAASGHTVGEAVAQLTEAVTYQITVVLPGEVIDTNADLVQERTLIWHVPAGRRVELSAEGALPRMPVVPLLGGGVLAALAAAWWLRRRAAGDRVSAG